MAIVSLSIMQVRRSHDLLANIFGRLKHNCFPDSGVVGLGAEGATCRKWAVPPDFFEVQQVMNVVATTCLSKKFLQQHDYVFGCCLQKSFHSAALPRFKLIFRQRICPAQYSNQSPQLSFLFITCRVAVVDHHKVKQRQVSGKIKKSW